MLRNLHQTINNLNGTPIRDKQEDGAEAPVLTIKSVACAALLWADDGQKPTAETSLARHMLATRLYAGGEQELTNEDCVLIKRLVGVSQPPLVSGQVTLWCDTNPAPTPKTAE